MAGYIREQYRVKDVVDDQGILNTFTLWLQGVHHKTASEANEEARRLAPPGWGSWEERPRVRPLSENEGVEVIPSTPPPLGDSPTELFSEEEQEARGRAHGQ